MSPQEAAVFYPKSLAAWRKWLEKNHESASAVWLVFYKKSSGKPSITWSEAVDVALCYGWIDSKKVAVDNEKSHQFFSKRKAKSTWSKINKDKVRQLMDAGLMMPAGLKIIEAAKQNGSWTLLDEVEQLLLPPDLEQALAQQAGAKAYFLNLSKSAKKILLLRLVLAKKQETRQKRIDEILVLAAQKLNPKIF